jgi:hypothetical protein
MLVRTEEYNYQAIDMRVPVFFRTNPVPVFFSVGRGLDLDDVSFLDADPVIPSAITSKKCLKPK